MSRRAPRTFTTPPESATKGSEIFWRSLEEKRASEPADASAEFPFKVAEQAPAASRREVMKYGLFAVAAFGLEGCLRRPVEKILPYTRQPEQTIPGIATHYATVINRRGEALGLLVESHEGRPTKIEGNLDHPSSRGGTDMIAQATVWDLYDPDRASSPMQGAAKKTWDEADAALAAKLTALEADKGAKLRVLAEPTNSPTFMRLRDLVKARFPAARFHTWSAVGTSNAREGARLAFGQPVNAIYDYGRAAVIVSLDCDFLQTEPGMVRATRAFSNGRRVRTTGQPMSRLYAVESAFTTTGANADDRLRLAAGDVERYARLLAKELGANGVDLGAVGASLGNHPADGIPPAWIASVAKELAANKGRAVVVAGSGQPASVHALAHAINRALGSVGNVVSYTPVVDVLEQDNASDLRALALDMDAGKVDTLLVLGGNPVYDAPGDLKIADRLGKVPTSIYLGSHVNETADKCTWTIPRAHELETWGDQRALDGTWSVQQPLLAPLFGGRSEIETLARLAGNPKPGHELVKETMRAASTAGAMFEQQWRTVLQKGLVGGSAPFAFSPPDVRAADIAAELGKPTPARKPLAPQSLEATFLPCPKMMDGRHGNNQWLLELPDPMTKVVWDNVACLSPKTAKDLGIASGDLVELSREGASIQIAAWVQPGQADNSVALTLGWGRKKPGRYGADKGFDVNPLRSSEALHFVDGVALRKVGTKYPLSQTQDQAGMEGRPIAIDTTWEEYQKDPTFARDRSPSPRVLPLWNVQDYSQGHQWAMSIDLSTCTGCNACAIACQSENNVPVVGKDQVARGREMHWLRVDRYFLGTSEADPKVAFQPLMCVQCEQAPCENVCPVNATTHSPEGLNDMAYNRCIGTRYCANNCPYKVRRFNYLEFNADHLGPDQLYGTFPETLKMQKNPDVTVRFRGVMEKCTYCVQRIEEAKIASRRTGKPIKDGEIEIKTACQQACPANAIVFGDKNDPNSRIAELQKRDRAYELLADLGTHPRTRYLGKIRNPNKEVG